jgi:integrase
MARPHAKLTGSPNLRHLSTSATERKQRNGSIFAPPSLTVWLRLSASRSRIRANPEHEPWPQAVNGADLLGEFKRWRDGMAATPRKADYAWTTLARVLSFAKDRGRISNNPCERGGRLYAGSRADKVWTEHDVERLLAAANAPMTLALALWTGQRQGDLLTLPWSSYDGTHIRLRQSKSGQAVIARVGRPLKALLDATRRCCPTILANTHGQPWTSDGFRTSWRKLCDKAQIAGLTFHDLRGSAVTRLSLAGHPRRSPGSPAIALPMFTPFWIATISVSAHD